MCRISHEVPFIHCWFYIFAYWFGSGIFWSKEFTILTASSTVLHPLLTFSSTISVPALKLSERDYTVQDLGQIQMQSNSYYLFSQASPSTAIPQHLSRVGSCVALNLLYSCSIQNKGSQIIRLKVTHLKILVEEGYSLDNDTTGATDVAFLTCICLKKITET